MNLINQDGEEVGFFKWSWIFHNAVNSRLEKPIISWETALSMYYSNTTCSKNCQKEETQTLISKTDNNSLYITPYSSNIYHTAAAPVTYVYRHGAQAKFSL